MAILRKLESAGVAYTSVEANVVYRVESRMTGDVEERTGMVAYQQKSAAAPTKVYIRFDTLRQGEGRAINQLVEYAFDGMWLTEAQHSVKTLTRYQLAVAGQDVDPLKIGKSPFPLPFGQKVDEVLKYFDANTRAKAPADPPGTDYLRLITKPNCAEEINFQRLDMWVDQTTGLPAKMVSQNANKEVSTVVFSGMKTNEKVDPKIFVIERKPLPWQYKVEALAKQPAKGGQ